MSKPKQEMNIFVSSLIKLPEIRHTEIAKILTEKRADEIFALPLVRAKKTRRRAFQDYHDKDSHIEEIKSKNGQTKLLVSDCRSTGKEKQKILCWHCRVMPGLEENGMPIHIEEGREDGSLVNECKRGYFCDESCMYAFAQERAIPGSKNYHMYKQACVNAELLHKLKYPEKGCIIPAQPWELLKANGGTLDYDMWKHESLGFQALPGFIHTRISIPYMQI